MKFLSYFIPTGRLMCGAELIGTGYAGRGVGLNNPEMQKLRALDQHRDDAGPLPAGWYTPRQEASLQFHAPAFRLHASLKNQMYGRSGFWIHGRRKQGDVVSSTGCIVLDFGPRSRVGALLAEAPELWVTAAWWIQTSDALVLAIDGTVLGRIIQKSSMAFVPFFGSGMGEQPLMEMPTLDLAQALLVERVAEESR